LVRRARLPGDQFGPVMNHDGQELLVVNVPQGSLRLVLAEVAKMNEQLPKAYVR
jgi:hypothetical protein